MQQMLAGYLNDGSKPEPRPRGIKTYECMHAHAVAVEADQAKRWDNRALAERRKAAWVEFLDSIRPSVV